MTLPKIHRVVTGHDSSGKAIITSSGSLPNVFEFSTVPGTWFHEVWQTTGMPATIDNGEDPTLGAVRLSPPTNGTRIRYVDIPPDTEEYLKNGAKNIREGFSQIGEGHVSTVDEHSPHPVMHKTESVDYGIVIEGAITLILDDSEEELQQGSVVIQRGTNHAWANRSDRVCRMLFILVDGTYSSEIENAE